MSVRAHCLKHRESYSEFISNHSVATASGHLLFTLILFNPRHETLGRRCHNCIHFANKPERIHNVSCLCDQTQRWKLSGLLGSHACHVVDQVQREERLSEKGPVSSIQVEIQ